MAAAQRLVVDIGNSRIKWGLLGDDDSLAETWSSEHASAEWVKQLVSKGVNRRTKWAVSSVHPPMADELARVMQSLSDERAQWFRSAADVPVTSELLNPSSAGADRALNVLAAGRLAPEGQSGLVISCGTAITVERVSASRIWMGGAITVGLDLAARTLAGGTAQIPTIIPHSDRPACGRTTEDAVGGGVFWGTIGAVRELISRQGEVDWRIWTGGNAPVIGLEIEPVGTAPWVVPDLVLRGLAVAAFDASIAAIGKS